MVYRVCRMVASSRTHSFRSMVHARVLPCGEAKGRLRLRPSLVAERNKKDGKHTRHITVCQRPLCCFDRRVCPRGICDSAIHGSWPSHRRTLSQSNACSSSDFSQRLSVRLFSSQRWCHNCLKCTRRVRSGTRTGRIMHTNLVTQSPSASKFLLYPLSTLISVSRFLLSSTSHSERGSCPSFSTPFSLVRREEQLRSSKSSTSISTTP